MSNHHILEISGNLLQILLHGLLQQGVICNGPRHAVGDPIDVNPAVPNLAHKSVQEMPMFLEVIFDLLEIGERLKIQQ